MPIFYRSIVIVILFKNVLFLDWPRNLVLMIPKVVRGNELTVKCLVIQRLLLRFIINKQINCLLS